MTSLFRRFFASAPAVTDGDRTDYQALEGEPAGLETEYQRVIDYQLRRWGVPESCASVEVRQIGQDSRGRQSFVGVVRLSVWDRKAAIRLMLGLPLLQARVDRIVRALWLAEVSKFEGLWLQTTKQFHTASAITELRQLIISLTGPRGVDSESGEKPSRPLRLK